MAQITIKLPAKDKAKIKKQANAVDLSVSQWVRQLIRLALSR